MMISGENLVNNDNNKKVKKILLLSIVIVAVLMIAILGLTIYLQTTVLKISIDGVSSELPSDVIIIDQETNQIHISIKDFAKYVGYEAYNGEYEPKSEDTTKCYVQSQNEVAVFSLNSNIIYKTPPTNQPDYEKFTINEPVKVINNKLYTTPEGIGIAFNLSFNYSIEDLKVQIHTLPYLVQAYTNVAVNQGYTNISTEFNNQKAILYGMIVGERKVNQQDSKFGVISLTGTEIIGKKYDKIRFSESTKEFFFTLLGKVGIITSNGETKLSQFDEIKVLDKDLRLYLVKNNDKYGVLDNNGKILIHLEYDKIGIDSTLFSKNNIKNNYILYNNCILVERDKKFGIFNKNGEILVPVEYTKFGYVQGTSQVQTINNLLLVPQYEGIVICKAEGTERESINKYGIVNSLGKLIVPISFDKIYSIIINGNEEVYLETNGQSVKLNTYLQTISNQQIEDTNNTNNTNNNQTSENTVTEQNNIETGNNNVQNENNVVPVSE